MSDSNLQIPFGLVQAAIAYYGAYRDKIDEWIVPNARESEAVHAERQALKP